MNKDKLINDYKGLVVSIARKYQNNGLDFDDLMQEGYIGLLTASNKYDCSKAKFSTYASIWIKQAIIRAIEQTGSLIRIPSHAHTLCDSKALEYQDNYLGQDITNEASLGVLLNRIKDIINDCNAYEMYTDHYLHGLSFREIAKKNCVSKDTIRTKLNALHAKVQATLKNK